MTKHKLLLIALGVLFATPSFSQQYDTLIRNGKIVDGSGNPWFYGDVGILGDRIAFIGHAAEDVKAKHTIDATGLIVAPGFIDMLGQSEVNLLIDKRAVSKLTQGITTEITGEGESVAPFAASDLTEQKDFFEHFHLTIDWESLSQYFNRLAKETPAINLGTYVGAGQLRKKVLGQVNRAPTSNELRDMEEYVGDAMLDGAMGLSTALIYAPSNYAKTDELIDLAKIASKYGGIYATHMRNEGDDEISALDEAFRIAREANMPLEIFHLKVSGKRNWGKMPQVIAKIEDARANGIDVTADQYPYVASATSLGALIPPKYHEGGSEALVARLKDAATKQQIREELESGKGYENMWRGVGGPDGVMIVSTIVPELKQYEGRTLAAVAQIQHKEPFDTLCDLLIQSKDGIGAAYFSMQENDVRVAMQQPWVSVGTDYGEVAPDGPLGESKSHPRAYGSFARILGKYVREERVLRVEDAIRKFTSLPAQRVRLDHRGLLREDYFADLTIFDPKTVLDTATFESPNRPSVGIEYVFVNGVLALEHEKTTGQFAGRPLRGPAYQARAIAPEGLAPRGSVRGFVSDTDGWPLPRTKLTLANASGKEVASAISGREGRYEIPLEEPCNPCTLKASRMGFAQQTRGVMYNGSNPLWFGFALQRQVQAPH
ncbi:MAG TPA: amidohydrolase family protein [Terriglobales bacterium]|nr:amidohydrolase family protein [Terriglobales bacterium]